MESRKFDQLQQLKRDLQPEIDAKIAEFSRSEVGSSVIKNSQTLSNWKSGPPDQFFAGYAFKEFLEKQRQISGIEKSHPNDVKRVGAYCLHNWQVFVISAKRDLLVIRFWENIQPLRNILFTHPTVAETTADLSECNYETIKSHESDQVTIKPTLEDSQEKNKRNFIFSAELKAGVTTSLGYFLSIPQGLVNDDENQWVGGMSAIPSEVMTVMLIIKSEFTPTEPSWISVVMDSGFKMLKQQLDKNTQFTSDLQRPEFLAELRTWLTRGTTARFLEDKSHLPPSVVSILRQHGYRIGDGNFNIYRADFKNINPLTYQLIIFKTNNNI